MHNPLRRYLCSANCKLVTLDLAWNSLGAVGAVDFAAALKRNQTLRSLNLAANGCVSMTGSAFHHPIT